MRIIGLTGGIASGKSVVARILEGLGGVIIDADQLAREVVAPGEPAYLAIVDEFGEEMPASAGSAKTLPLVDFVVRPHFRSDYFPQTTPENVGKWADRVAHPLYAIDDQSALKVVDGKVEEVSEGTWRLFAKL